MAAPRRHPHLQDAGPLAVGPFGPFLTPGAEGATPTPVTGPLVDAGLYEEAVLYRSLFKVSDGRITPRDADQLTFWEASILLGIPTPEFPTDNDRPAPTAGGHRNSAARTRAAELNRQRLAHSRGQGPAPEARAVDGTTLNQVSAALS